MQKYLTWIVVATALALAIFTYFENRRLIRRLEETLQQREGAQIGPNRVPLQPTPVSTEEDSSAPRKSPSPRAPVQATPLPRILQGICRDPERKPIPGVQITAIVRGEADSPQETVTAMSDSEGRFGITHEPGQTFLLIRGELEGYAPAEVSGEELANTRVVELTLHPLASCEVHIFFSRQDGALERYEGPATIYILRRTPAPGEPGATDFSREATARPGRFVTIGAENIEVHLGLHVLQGYPEGVYKIALVAGEEYAESEPFKLDRTGQVVATVVLGGRVRYVGRVLSKSDESPIPDAQVQLVPQKLPDSRIAQQLKKSAAAAADGRFAFEKVVPGVYALTIAADGFTTQVVEDLIISPDRPADAEDTFFLVPGSPELTLSVVGPDRAPARRARVAVYSPEAAMPLPTLFGETDSEGRLALKGLLPGRYSVIVTLPHDHNRQKQIELVVDAERMTTEPIPVVFEPLVRVRGTARLTSGDPYTGLLYFVRRGTLGPKTFSKCNLDGVFQVELEPGEFSVGKGDQPASTLVKILALDDQEISVIFP